jgi:hypothetical protein
MVSASEWEGCTHVQMREGGASDGVEDSGTPHTAMERRINILELIASAVIRRNCIVETIQTIDWLPTKLDWRS